MVSNDPAGRFPLDLCAAICYTNGHNQVFPSKGQLCDKVHLGPATVAKIMAFQYGPNAKPCALIHFLHQIGSIFDSFRTNSINFHLYV